MPWRRCPPGTAHRRPEPGGTSFVPKGSEHTEAATEFIGVVSPPIRRPRRPGFADAEAPSSVLPADPGLQKVAATEFAPAADGYFANDLYQVAADQVDTVVTG